MNTCGTCRWFASSICARLICWSHDINEITKRDGAMIVPDSHYHDAELYVDEAFGCIKWEERK